MIGRHQKMLTKHVKILGSGSLSKEILSYISRAPSLYACTIDIYNIEDSISNVDKYVVGTGTPKSNKYLYHKVREIGALPSLLNFGASYSHLMQNGMVICPGSVITCNVDIGKCVLVNLNCTIGHDTQVGDFCVINPGANISGNVKIGELTLVGTGAVIREGITIGKRCTIGAGAVVVKDVPDGETWVGNPAKKLR